MKRSKKEPKGRILSLTKKKVQENTIKASKVTRDLFSGIWRDHLDEVRNMAGELKSVGK